MDVTSHCRALLLARLARTRALIDSHCCARCPTTFMDVTSHCRTLLLARLARTRPLIDSHCRARCQSTFMDATSHCRALLRSHARQCDDHSENMYKYRHDRAFTPTGHYPEARSRTAQPPHLWTMSSSGSTEIPWNKVRESAPEGMQVPMCFCGSLCKLMKSKIHYTSSW